MPAWRLATVLFLVAVLFNVPWELAQSPLFVAMPPLPARLWCCFVASLGMACCSCLWVAGWAVFRQKVWFGSPSAVRYVAIVVAGVGLGVVVEVAALETGRWSYGPRCPVSGV